MKKSHLFVLTQYNLSELTYNAVETLFASGIPDSTKIVVLDNHSPDREWINKFRKFKGIKILILPSNLRWLGAFNYALRYAFKKNNFDSLIYSNNDVLFSKEFIKNYVIEIEKEYYGILAPLYNDVNPHQRIPNMDHIRFRTQPLRVKQVPYVDGTCVCITKGVFNRIGYLDSDFSTSGGWGADIDYCIRAKKENIRIGVIMNTYLDHLGHRTSIRFDQNRASFNSIFREILKRKYGKEYVKLWYRLR